MYVLIPRPPERTSKLQESSALKENIHPPEIYFFLLLFLWVFFALLDPDPDLVDQNNADPLEKLQESKNTKTMANTEANLFYFFR